MPNDSHNSCFCYVEDLDTARRKAILAENTSDLDTAASDVEKMLSRKKRTRNLISDDDDVEPETTPKAYRPPGKKLPAQKELLPLPSPPVKSPTISTPVAGPSHVTTLPVPPASTESGNASASKPKSSEKQQSTWS